MTGQIGITYARQTDWWSERVSKGKRENVCVCVYVLMPHPFALHNIYTQTMAGRRPIVFPVYFAHSILVGSISNTHTTVLYTFSVDQTWKSNWGLGKKMGWIEYEWKSEDSNWWRHHGCLGEHSSNGWADKGTNHPTRRQPFIVIVHCIASHLTLVLLLPSARR